MKRNSTTAMLVILTLVFSIGFVSVSAEKPVKTMLDVTITSPQEGLVIENGGFIDVAGSVVSLKGDAGLVATYVQYAVGEGSTDFYNLGTDPDVLHITIGNQPQTQALLSDEFYDVSWILTGPAGTYEIRIYSEGEQAKSSTSDPVTVRILGAPPPPGVEVIDSEGQDPLIGYGSAIGSFENTYHADGSFEILTEGMNTQGTKKPVDDTTELGWIFTFDLPTPRTSTTFYFYGYAEFQEDDGDTAFYVQEDSGGVWSTVLEIQNIGGSKIYSANIADQYSSILKLRIVDNDQTIGDKEISSLYIDQAFIGLDDYEPPMSGIEILTTPYTGHGFQAWENYGTDWYHDADIFLHSEAATDIEAVDLDFDGNNELVVGESISPIYGVGVIEIFDFDIGTSPIEILVLPASTNGAIIDITVGNFDVDPDYEIAAATTAEGDGVIWDKVNGQYEIALFLQDAGVLWSVTSGNLDDDPESEIVFGIGWDPVQCKVALYDYDAGLDTWINTANYTNFQDGPNHNSFYRLDVNDINNDNYNELYVMYSNGPFNILTYTGDELVDFWTVPDVTVQVDIGYSFVLGDITNDGALDLVFYSPFLDTGTGFLVFEYDDVLGFVNTYNISNPGMANIFGEQMAIGDVDGDLVNELVVAGGPGGIYSEGKLFIFRYDSLIFSAELDANESNCVVICDYDNDA